MKKFLIAAGMILLLLTLTIGGYILYMQLNYYRIEDNTQIETQNNQTGTLKAGSDYTAVTYNIGFGAYEQAYTFFMDTGKMKDGTATQGKKARAFSQERAAANTQNSIQTMLGLDSDFYLIEEADLNSTRSYGLNQVQAIRDAFSSYGSVYTNAFHTPFLFYPFTEPHGSVESGLVTLSRYQIEQNIRRQLPVDNGFITKFTDLDRCFTISYVPVDHGKTLALVALHLSAYDEGGKIRQKQLEMLNEVLLSEYEKGNYVIAGGDFNHDIAGTIDLFPSQQEIPEWVFQLDNSSLAEGLSFVIPKNVSEVPSCRGADIPYEKGVTYTVTVDGFIVSDNVEASSVVINTDFASSDHQPVKLSFRLK